MTQQAIVNPQEIYKGLWDTRLVTGDATLGEVDAKKIIKVTGSGTLTFADPSKCVGVEFIVHVTANASVTLTGPSAESFRIFEADATANDVNTLSTLAGNSQTLVATAGDCMFVSCLGRFWSLEVYGNVDLG